MPKFYFHVREDSVLYEDRRGADFPDIVAAWHRAKADVRAMIDEGQLSGPPDNYWVEICDPLGKTVASLPFVRVLH